MPVIWWQITITKPDFKFCFIEKPLTRRFLFYVKENYEVRYGKNNFMHLTEIKSESLTENKMHFRKGNNTI